MSVLFLLDTDTISHAVRHPAGVVSERLLKYRADIATSSIVASELRFGIAQRTLTLRPRQSDRLGSRIERVLGLLDIRPYDESAADHYGAIRAELEQTGYPIGALDTLIAAHARSLKATLVTNNLDHFQRVPGLKVVTWI